MTPADKPELPKIPAWARAIMTTHERRTLSDHIQRQIDAARADERRKVLELAAQACTSTMLMNIDSYCGATAHACADRIRALIDKEPTT